jgi:hypothetical protein
LARRNDSNWLCCSCEPCTSCVISVNEKAQTTIYLRLLRDGLSQLKLSGRLKSPWDVVVTYSDPDNPDTTFSVQPSQQDRTIPLDALRTDVGEVARSLDSMMRDGAHTLRHQGRRRLPAK